MSGIGSANLALPIFLSLFSSAFSFSGQTTWTVTVFSALQPDMVELRVKVLRPADPNLESS